LILKMYATTGIIPAPTAGLKIGMGARIQLPRFSFFCGPCVVWSSGFADGVGVGVGVGWPAGASFNGMICAFAAAIEPSAKTMTAPNAGRTFFANFFTIINNDLPNLRMIFWGS